MATVKVSNEFMPYQVTVRVAKELDQAAPAAQPSATPAQPSSPVEEDLINKKRIIDMVHDHHNKIDKITVTEEKGGKKRVQFEVSPQGVLRSPSAQQPAAQAPAQAPAAPAPAAPAPAQPAMASSSGIGKTAADQQVHTYNVGVKTEAGSHLTGFQSREADPRAAVSQWASAYANKVGKLVEVTCPDHDLRFKAEPGKPPTQLKWQATMPASAPAFAPTTAKKKGKKKEWDPNPWAVCHTTVEKDSEPEKFENCVQDVKKKQAAVEFPDGFLEAMGMYGCAGYIGE